MQKWFTPAAIVCGLMFAIAPILIHLAFYKLLRIPLPWGVFEQYAF